MLSPDLLAAKAAKVGAIQLNILFDAKCFTDWLSTAAAVGSCERPFRRRSSARRASSMRSMTPLSRHA